MTILTISLDGLTEQSLLAMAAGLNVDPSDMAARLIKRAIRAARPKPVFDVEALKAYTAENMAEELALAESDLEHRYQLLLNEDLWRSVGKPALEVPVYS